MTAEPAAPPLNPTIVAYLRRDGLLHDGHFAYRSGRHNLCRVDRDRLLADPSAASRMGYALAKRFFTAHVETVAAPSIWGAGLAQWVAYFLDPRAKVVDATPRNGRPTVASELEDLIRGRRVLLVDNLVISGETLTAFDAAVDELGGQVLGIGALWNGSAPEIAGHPVFGLLNDLFPAYPPEACPACAAGAPPLEEAGY